MPKNLDEQYEFLGELKKLVKQVEDLLETSGNCPAEEHSKPALTAELMAAFSAVLAATASKSGVWCKNINQNGVANNSNIYPDHEISLEKLIGRLNEIGNKEIIAVKGLKGESVPINALIPEDSLTTDPYCKGPLCCPVFSPGQPVSP